MRAYALIASKQKVNIEKALNEFIALAKGKEVCFYFYFIGFAFSGLTSFRLIFFKPKDNPVALLGTSRAYMLLKQAPKVSFFFFVFVFFFTVLSFAHLKKQSLFYLIIFFFKRRALSSS